VAHTCFCQKRITGFAASFAGLSRRQYDI